MRAVAIGLGIFVLACQRDAASTTPEEASASSDDGSMAPPSTSEEPVEAEEVSQAVLEVEGGLTEAQVEEVVGDHHREIKECFDLALAHPEGVDLLAPVVVQIQVDSAGKVTGSELESSNFGSEETETCIVERTGAWTFPAPKGKKAATLHVPFLLRSY